jgi:hypothetical protein
MLQIGKFAVTFVAIPVDDGRFEPSVVWRWVEGGLRRETETRFDAQFDSASEAIEFARRLTELRAAAKRN